MKKLLYCIVLFAITISCTKDEKTDLDLESMPESLSEINILNENGILLFNNQTEFEVLTKLLHKSDQFEIESFKERLGFSVFIDVAENYYSEIENITTFEEAENYVNLNSQFLELKLNENQEHELFIKEQSKHIIFQVLGIDRIYKIGNVYTKILNEYSVSSNSKEKLYNIKTDDEAKNSDLSPRQIIVGKETSENRAVGLSDEEINNNPFCKNDRKILWEAWAFHEFVGTEGGDHYHLIGHSAVIAKRKGIPCIWYKYNTNITWNDFLNKILFINPNSTSTQVGVWHEQNTVQFAKQILRSHIYSSFVIPENSLPIVFSDWCEVQTKATHQGMAGIWIIVSLFTGLC